MDFNLRARGALFVASLLVAFVTGCGGGGSSNSQPTTAPNAPSALAAFADDGSVTLSWASVANATEYDVYWAPGNTVTMGSSSLVADVTSPFVHTGLANGSKYSYLVRASNAVGASDPSAPISATPQSGGGAQYEPSWASATPLATYTIAYNSGASAAANGVVLANALANALPGDDVVVADGTWALPLNARLVLQGTSTDPIRIRAAIDGGAILTDASSSTSAIIALGDTGSGPAAQTRYVSFRGFEVTGAGAGIELGNAANVWVDRCHVHDVGGQGILAASNDTDHIYVTRCEIHDTSGFGEGIAFGSNSTGTITHDSVIALNSVHDTRATTEGDGIDLRWECHTNWIAENRVHHTRYPAIIFHGTGIHPSNLIEKNICWDTLDNVMQADGGNAIVRNNVLLGPCVNKVFDSTHHEATLRDLVVVHNTMIAQGGYCAGLFGWNGQPNLVFANNAVFSNPNGFTGYAIAVGDGHSGGALAGNVVVGYTPNVSSGFTTGNGLSDLANVNVWSYAYANLDDVRPNPLGALVGAADPAWVTTYDLEGTPRTNPVEAGALEAH